MSRDPAWGRLRHAALSRPTRGQAIIGVLCALLGFGIVQQVSSVRTQSPFASARTEDLVQILDSLDQRSQRLDAQITTLTAARDRLRSSRDAEAAAAKERQRRADEVGILAGTVAAEGPGVVVTLSGEVSAGLVLDTVQELRDAGAEAMEINGQRVVVSTAFTDSDTAVLVNGKPVGGPKRPIVIRAIGNSATLATSLTIPGGVVETAAADGVRVTIVRAQTVTVRAVVPAPTRS
ncbi:MAG TPA: hypothetical protein DHW34_00790 [Actinobacteria bacterium]|nr:hypothetical protein [Actinomycetota bacterium]